MHSELQQVSAPGQAWVASQPMVHTPDGLHSLPSGHSLLLVHAQSKVTEALRVKISMVEMFKYPTVSALAEHLSQQHSAPATAAPTKNQAESRIEALNRQRQLRQRAARRST